MSQDVLKLILNAVDIDESIVESATFIDSYKIELNTLNFIGRWECASEYYRASYDLETSYVNEKAEFQIRHDMVGNKYSRMTNVYDTQFNTNVNLIKHQRSHTGNIKKYWAPFSGSSKLIERVLSQDLDIHSFPWKLFDFNSLLENSKLFDKDAEILQTQIEDGISSRGIKQEVMIKEIEANIMESTFQPLLEADIELKIKPQGEFKGLNYVYNIVHSKSSWKYRDWFILSYMYAEQKYYIACDLGTENFSLNALPKEKGKGFFSSLFS